MKTLSSSVRWVVGLAALVGLVAMGTLTAQTGLPQVLMYGVNAGLPRALSVDASGNLNVTANLSGADGAIQDGVTPSIEATVYDFTNSNPVATAIVDASGNQITSFGGGTQYTTDSAQATPVGTVALGWDGTNVRALNTTTGGVLNINNIAGTVTLPTGAASAANQSTEITALQIIDNLVLTQGSTTSGQNGALVMGAVTTSAPSYTTGQTSPLSLALDGSLRVSGAAGTTQYAEDSVATDGQQIVGLGFVRRDTTPTGSAGAAGDYAWGNVDANGRIYVQAVLYNSSGTELSPSLDVTEDAAETAGGTGPMVLSVRRDAAATSAGTTGDNATFNTDAAGLLWSRTIDPCTAVLPTTTTLSATADTVLISASASNRNYICSGMISAGTAETISIWEGTGTTCGTGSTAVIGSTTEANGVALGANGGFIIPRTVRGLATNVDTCLRLNGANRVVMYVTYVQAP